MSWEEIEIGNLFDIKHGYAFKSKYFQESGKYVLTSPGHFHLLGGFRKREGKEKYSTEIFDERYLLRENDIIIAMTEQGEGLLGSTAIVPENDKYLHNQRLGLVQNINIEKIYWKYIPLLLNEYKIRKYISNSSTGTKVKHTSPKRILELKCQLPSLKVQKRIANITYAYDDLIENNLKRIKLLEQAAQNIYKEWFVHLRFPGHEKTRINEETGLPVGWEEKKLNEITSLITKGTTPTSVGYKFTEEGINFIKAESYNDNGFFKRNKFAHISKEAHQKLKRSQLKKDDIIFSIAGVIGRCAIIKSELLPANTNQAVAIIRLSETYNNFPSFIKYSLSQKSVRDYTNAIRVQAAQANINLKQLGELKIIIPTNEMVIRYNDVVSYNVKQMNILFRYNQKLKAARDILLPRLMNRTIEV